MREVNFFLTGPRHSGKSTVLFRVLREQGLHPRGFAVKRVYSGGRLACFRLVDLGRRQSATVVYQDEQGVWCPDVRGFDGVGAEAVLAAVSQGSLVVMDELGTFEEAARVFLAAVQTALDSAVPVVGILKEARSQFLDGIRRRPDTRVVRMEPHSRSWAEQELRTWLTGAVGLRKPKGTFLRFEGATGAHDGL